MASTEALFPTAYLLIGEYPWKKNSLHIVGAYRSMDGAYAALRKINQENDAWNEWMTSKQPVPAPACRHLKRLEIVICPLAP